MGKACAGVVWVAGGTYAARHDGFGVVAYRYWSLGGEPFALIAVMVPFEVPIAVNSFDGWMRLSEHLIWCS